VQTTIAGVADSRIPISSFLSFYLFGAFSLDGIGLTRVVLDAIKGGGEIAGGDVVS
jgi:hypothetical protein